MSNAEKLSPNVKINIKGVERELKFTLGAFRRLEMVTGKNSLNGEIWKNPGASEVVALVWAALNDSSLTIDDVGDMLELADSNSINSALTQAFQLAHCGSEKKSKTTIGK